MGQQKTLNKLGITWTDETVNPLSGCSRVSPGCLNCWASDTSYGLKIKGQVRHEGLTVLDSRGHHKWTGKLDWKPSELNKLSSLSGKRIFINSMSDTFHEAAEIEWIDAIFKAMQDNPQNTYQVLTKRAGAMLEYLKDREPMAHVWLGFSAENQEWFDHRWADVRQLAEAGWITWASIEPQVGAITLGDATDLLSWVVIGGDNTLPHKDAREFDIAWAVSLIDECQNANVPVFMKQVGVRPYWTIEGKAYPWKASGEGKHMIEWPEHIRIQQFP